MRKSLLTADDAQHVSDHRALKYFFESFHRSPKFNCDWICSSLDHYSPHSWSLCYGGTCLTSLNGQLQLAENVSANQLHCTLSCCCSLVAVWKPSESLPGLHLHHCWASTIWEFFRLYFIWQKTYCIVLCHGLESTQVSTSWRNPAWNFSWLFPLYGFSHGFCSCWVFSLQMSGETSVQFVEYVCTKSLFGSQLGSQGLSCSTASLSMRRGKLPRPLDSYTQNKLL